MPRARALPACCLTILATLLLAVSANAALYDHSVLYAANYDAGDVQRLALDANGTPVSNMNYDASAQATATIIDPEGTALFVGSAAGNTIDGYAIGAGGDLSARVSTTPSNGTDLAMTPDGSFLYGIKADSGPSSSGAFQGYAVNGATLSELSPTYTLPSSHIATAIAISPDGTSLYVAAANVWNGAGGFIYRYAIHPVTGALSGATLAASGFTASVFNLGISPDGRSLYAPSPAASAVYQFDIAAGTGALAPKAAPSIATFSTPYSIALTPDGKFAYANSQYDLTRFSVDATTGALTTLGGSQSAGFFGRGSTVSPDSKNLYTGSFGLNHFTIDTSTGALTDRPTSVAGGQLHVGLAFTPDQGPVAAYTAVPALEGSATTFDATASTDSDGTVATYVWDFGDGSAPVSGGPTISHTFATAGSYAVNLTVSDEMGCSTTRTYTGHMVHCNGGAAARQTQTIVIDPVAPPVVVAPPAVVPDPVVPAPVVVPPDSEPVPAPVPAPVASIPAAAVAPSVGRLTVARRCVRSAARAAFAFTLSQDATVRYEVLRRDGSPRWTSCPRLGGTMPISFSGVWDWAAAVGAGPQEATLAARRSPTRMRMRQGRHRVTLARLVGSRPLAAGTHLLRITATNATGQSTTAEVKFWIVGPSR